MIRRLLAVAAWLAAGHALLFGIFWLFLQVPESNVLMLFASAALGLVMVMAAGSILGVGLAAWTPGTRWRDAVARGPRAIVPFLLGLVCLALVWWATGAAGDWWSAHRGEIDAWLMLHFAWTRTAKLHAVAGWLVLLVRYVVGTTLLVTPAAWWLARGASGLKPPRWLGAAFSPRRLLLIAAAVMALVWLPWQAAYWRPEWLAPNWQETAFAIVKLGTLWAVAHVGWALVLWTVEKGARPQAT